MKPIKTVIVCLLAAALSLCLSACASVPLLKGSDFSAEYRSFINKMQKHPPVSVYFEQYKKTEGFQEENLITDTDEATIRELVNALAAVRITGQVSEASNFAVRHYTFTDKNGAAFTFEFYGSYLKADGKIYQTENALPFISIRLTEKKSGTFLAALDEAYEGRGVNEGRRYLSCRILEETDGKLAVISHEDFELTEQSRILAPATREPGSTSETIGAEDFFAHYEQRKGQENANYIFTVTVQTGVIVSLTYEAEYAAAEQLL